MGVETLLGPELLSALGGPKVTTQSWEQPWSLKGCLSPGFLGSVNQHHMGSAIRYILKGDNAPDISAGLDLHKSRGAYGIEIGARVINYSIWSILSVAAIAWQAKKKTDPASQQIYTKAASLIRWTLMSFFKLATFPDGRIGVVGQRSVPFYQFGWFELLWAYGCAPDHLPWAENLCKSSGLGIGLKWEPKAMAILASGMQEMCLKSPEPIEPHATLSPYTYLSGPTWHLNYTTLTLDPNTPPILACLWSKNSAGVITVDWLPPQGSAHIRQRDSATIIRIGNQLQYASSLYGPHTLAIPV